MRRVSGLLVLLAALAPSRVPGVSLDGLDLGVEWKLKAVRIRGNRAVPKRELRKAIETQPRRWFAIWRKRPAFDPAAFRTDLARLQRAYRARGFYHARVGHDLELPDEGDTLVAVVEIEEGPPVLVERVEVMLSGDPVPPKERTELLENLPVHEGDVFAEEAYDKAFTYLRAAYREWGYARVEVTKWAEVDATRDRATVSYRAESGPRSVFGAIEIAGTQRVEPAVVRRELDFEPGDRFAQSRIDQSRRNLASLSLFRGIRLDEDRSRDPRVDMRVQVEEGKAREVRLGIGYDTEEQVRGLAAWRHYNFLGGARQLGFTARASLIARAFAADFLQPHFPGSDNRTRLLFVQAQDEEDTYTLDRTRLSPRFEWQATPRVTGFVFHRSEYDSLSEVTPAVERALPGVAPANAFLSGIGIGADWNATDDLLDPTRGFVITGTVEPVGGVLGGDVAFVRGTVEGRIYQPLVRRLSGAARLRLGTAEPIADSDEIPLYERFYSGGINSVRGYGRRRLGPLIADEPVGGRRLAEASLELRHPITDKLGAALFVDAGQVAPDVTPVPRRAASLRRDQGAEGGTFDFPFDDLRFGAGFGVRYKSPVGPLRVDLAFPTDPPPGDNPWQVHLSLGAAF